MADTKKLMITEKDGRGSSRYVGPDITNQTSGIPNLEETHETEQQQVIKEQKWRSGAEPESIDKNSSR